MRTRVQRWGNSLGLRIPSAFAKEAQLEHNTEVEVMLQDGRLVVVRVGDPTLEELLAGVTDENLHAEVDFGPAAGRETW